MELRTITPERSGADAEAVAWVRASRAAFLGGRLEPEQLAQVAGTYAGHRLRGVHEPGDPAPVATLRSWDARLTVPGGDVAVDAVSSIGIRSTHRRRGLLRRLLDEDLRRAARAGTPVAALTSTQGSLYERFGFGLATWSARLRVDTAGARFRGPAPQGGAEVIGGAAAFAALAAPVHARARRRHPGAMSRDAGSWEELFTGATGWTGMTPDPMRHAVLWRDAEGRPAGYCVHRVEEGWYATGAATLGILDLQATTPEAHEGLWRHLCADDLVGTVRWADASIDDPLPWLLDDHRAASVEGVSSMLWLRVLDVPAALIARTYPVPDVLRLLVHDADGHAAGRWRLDTTDATAPRVERLGPAEDVDAETDACGLASLYLGGADPRVLARGGRLTEHAPGAAGRLARVFAAPSVPWNGTRF